MSFGQLFRSKCFSLLQKFGPDLMKCVRKGCEGKVESPQLIRPLSKSIVRLLLVEERYLGCSSFYANSTPDHWNIEVTFRYQCKVGRWALPTN